MSNKHYILVRNEVVEEPDLITWARWMERWEGPDSRRVAHHEYDGIEVSTVFLGLDHNWADTGPPIVFETMVFMGDKSDLECERYCTYDEALLGHIAMCNKVFNKEWKEQALAERNAESD